MDKMDTIMIVMDDDTSVLMIMDTNGGIQNPLVNIKLRSDTFDRQFLVRLGLLKVR